jgi:hypothetical protein
MSARRLGFGLLATIISLASCNNADDRLDTLRTDPMAAYELPGATDTVTTEFAGGTSDVSSPSMIRNTFTVPDSGVAAAIDEIAAAAVAAGWVLTGREPSGYSGDKDIDDISAQILIAGIDNDNTVWVEVSSRSG